MKPTFEIIQAFKDGRTVAPIKFVLYDQVTIISGPNRGLSATVMHLQMIAPEVVYLVEFEDGQFADVFQSSLRRF